MGGVTLYHLFSSVVNNRLRLEFMFNVYAREGYVAPALVVLEICQEGLLCTSPLKPGENEDGILGDDL